MNAALEDRFVFNWLPLRALVQRHVRGPWGTQQARPSGAPVLLLGRLTIGCYRTIKAREVGWAPDAIARFLLWRRARGSQTRDTRWQN